MALAFDPNYYAAQRPDVVQAYINLGATPGTGLSWPEFAEQHFNNFGWKEGTNPNSIFDVSDYLTATRTSSRPGRTRGSTSCSSVLLKAALRAHRSRAMTASTMRPT